MQVVSVDITKVKKLLKEYEDLTIKSEELRTMAAVAKAEAIALCPHSITESYDDHCEGSYLDRASTTTYTVCGICGLQLDVNTVTHNWYG